jgi:hypothetical protein
LVEEPAVNQNLRDATVEVSGGLSPRFRFVMLEANIKSLLPGSKCGRNGQKKQKIETKKEAG